MIERPTIGVTKRSYGRLYADALIEDYSRLVGVSLQDAEEIVWMMGAVIQDHLARGQPSGLPGVGAIMVKYRDYKVDVDHFFSNYPNAKKRWLEGKGPKGIPQGSGTYIKKNVPQLVFRTNKPIRGLIRWMAPYTGTEDEHFRMALAEAKRKHLITKSKWKLIKKQQNMSDENRQARLALSKEIANKKRSIAAKRNFRAALEWYNKESRREKLAEKGFAGGRQDSDRDDGQGRPAKDHPWIWGYRILDARGKRTRPENRGREPKKPEDIYAFTRLEDNEEDTKK